MRLNTVMNLSVFFHGLILQERFTAHVLRNGNRIKGFLKLINKTKWHGHLAKEASTAKTTTECENCHKWACFFELPFALANLAVLNVFYALNGILELSGRRLVIRIGTYIILFFAKRSILVAAPTASIRLFTCFLLAFFEKAPLTIAIFVFFSAELAKTSSVFAVIAYRNTIYARLRISANIILRFLAIATKIVTIFRLAGVSIVSRIIFVTHRHNCF